MVFKYIVLLYFIYIVVTAERITDEEIIKLWWKNSCGECYIYEKCLKPCFNYLNEKEIHTFFKHFGESTYTYNEVYKRVYALRLDFDGFKKAAKKGFIPRWPLRDISEVFMEITKKGNRNYRCDIKLPDWSNGVYVLLKEMVTYYPQNCITKLKKAMRKFGKFKAYERRLYFKGFIRAMNLDLIPEP